MIIIFLIVSITILQDAQTAKQTNKRVAERRRIEYLWKIKIVRKRVVNANWLPRLWLVISTLPRKKRMKLPRKMKQQQEKQGKNFYDLSRTVYTTIY